MRRVQPSFAEQTARTDGDHSLAQIVPFVGVVAVLVEEHEQSVALVLLQDQVFARSGGHYVQLVDREHERDQRDERTERDEQIPQTGAAYHEHYRADEQVHQSRSQVRLEHDGDERRHDAAKRLQVLAGIVQPSAIARQHARVEQNDRDLRELARL